MCGKRSIICTFSIFALLSTGISFNTQAAITDASAVLYYGGRCKGPDCGIPDEGGVWISNYKTKSVTCIWGGKGVFTDGAYFRPDGKEVAIIKQGTLYIVNSDGTNERSYKLPNWVDDRNDWNYTTNGIFYCGTSNKTYCFDLNTKTSRSIVTGFGSRLTVSSDGLRGYDIGALNGDKGGKIYEMSSINGTAVKKDFGIWGHGNAISGGGKYIFMLRWTGHNVILIYDFTKPGYKGSTKQQGYIATFSTDVAFGSGCPNWRSPKQVVNSDVYVCVPLGNQYKQDGIKIGIINWKDTTEKVMIPARGVANVGNAYVGTITHAEKPIIKLDKSELVFSAPGADNPAPQMVSVSNEGKKTLSQVATSISYTDGKDWLSAAVGAGGGNAQTITNTISASALADGQYSATVTVSGGGADNSVSYTVTLNKGAAPASPSSLKAENTGDSLRDVSLTWNDNSDNETGFAIERKEGDGTFAQIHTTDADAVSYFDKGLTEATTYVYRIKALSSAGDSKYSTETSVLVAGVPWIKVQSPADGQAFPLGATIQIQWTANKVTNVQIDYSVDDGLSWKPITEVGGVLSTEQAWGNFTWTVPDISAQKVVVKVSDYGEPEPFGVSGAFTIDPSASVRNYRTATHDRRSLANARFYSISGRLLSGHDGRSVDLHNSMLPSNVIIVKDSRGTVRKRIAAH
jgi:hypothetical protein